MTWLVHISVRFIRIIRHTYERKWLFLAFTLVIFLFSEALLAHADLLPDMPTASATVAATPNITLNTSPLVVNDPISGTKVNDMHNVRELPSHIKIPAINLSVAVLNPNTTNIRLLDKALLSGAVRYPLSATLGENGNVIIFGHSSYLLIPFDEPYKTFNGIQNLKKGEHILVSSKTKTYIYSVDTESKKNISSAAIPLQVSGSILTLSTCDSFGKKSDRFVVTAHLVGSYPIGS